MNKIRIASAIASKHGVTLYLEDGKVLNLPSDSWKTKAILDEVLGPLARHKVVTIDLDNFSVESAIEKKTNGVIRFFKRAIGALIGGSRDSELSTTTSPVAVEAAAPAQEELVAVVKTKNGDKEIPGVQKLARQMEHAAYNGNAKGLQKFMERIAKVIDQRGHTVQELLTFMERGDLPIADDGSIVAYKILTSTKEAGVFVDGHTKRVRQKLGSRVSMNPKLVDPSRRAQCSAGLHVARRGYLRGFPGDVITLIKIGPEDVIAVPFNEPDKMRVAAYHIVANLPAEVHAILRNNQPMTGNATAAQILADVIAGNHVGVLEYVRIGEDGAEKITNRQAKNQAPAPAPFKNGETKALDDAKTLTPKEIRSQAQAAKAEKPAKKAAPKKTPSAAPANDNRDAKIARALQLVGEGKLSMRAIERETGVPARTIGRVLKNK